MTERSMDSKNRQLPSLCLQTTQHAHLFPKNKRFIPQNPECPEAFYNTRSLLSTKGSGFGYGKKSDFTRNLVISPGSNKYNPDASSKKSKGRTFGCSRESSPNKSYISPQLKDVPGPGEYDDGLGMRRTGRFKSKTIDACFPYNHGTYFSSRYKDTKLGTIDPATKRFPEIQLGPGPGNYYLDDTNMKANGYVISNHRGRGSRAFDKQARFTDSFWRVAQTPGPGKYEP